MRERFTAATVGEIVASDFRAAEVFERFGIDFCCSGRRSVADACRTAAADPDAVAHALDALPPPVETDEDVTRWPIPRLVDFIVSTHHAYVRSSMPAIARHVAKLQEVYGTRHPELSHVAAYFDQVRGDLEQHMLKEEQVLFPYMRDLAERPESCGRTQSPFGTVENPIRMMEREHREVADALRLIRALTQNYTPPADGCATYSICLSELHQFETDLHRHVYLENYLLFPKAVALESALVPGAENGYGGCVDQP